MKALRRLFHRLTSWATSARDEEFLRAEFEEHIAMQTADNLRAGLSPSEARRQALLKFGNVEAMKEGYRDQRGLPLTETLVLDTQHALRRLRKTPVFTAAVLLTLALGIGANTAIFAVIDSILIRPLPYPHAEDLMNDRGPRRPGYPASQTTLGVLLPCTSRTARRTESFNISGSVYIAGASLTGIAEPEQPRALFVTHGVLDTLGVKPLLGRWFSEADDTPGSPETVMLTHGYWQRRFGADTSIVGRTLTIESRPRTVIGVMPANFRFQGDPELILPQRFERNPAVFGTLQLPGYCASQTRRHHGAGQGRCGSHVGNLVVCLAPAAGNGLHAEFQNARVAPRIQPLKQDIVGNIGSTLWVVMAALGLVLLIACANVANLLLVRAEARQQELAIRAALGAGRGRIAREMLVESMTLGALGGAVGSRPGECSFAPPGRERS